MRAGPFPTTLEDQFWSRAHPIPEQGCWSWDGGLDSTGSGEVNWGGVNEAGKSKNRLRAYVASYVLHVGPVPDGLVVRHKCDNRECVNPDHLEVGTKKDNARDMMERGRGRGQFGS